MFRISPTLLTFKFIAQARIHAPVNEHPEPRLSPPGQTLVTSLHGFTPPRRFRTVFGREVKILRRRSGGFRGKDNASRTHKQSEEQEKRPAIPKAIDRQRWV